MSQYDDSGKVALWANASGNERAPKYKGHVFAHRDIKKGEKVALALWENEPGERRPTFRGKVEDIRQQPAAQEAPPPGPPPPDFDDELTF